MRAGPMVSLTFLTALRTPVFDEPPVSESGYSRMGLAYGKEEDVPFPPQWVLSPSRSSIASCWPRDVGQYDDTCEKPSRGKGHEPVEAPEGTMAR